MAKEAFRFGEQVGERKEDEQGKVGEEEHIVPKAYKKDFKW